MKAILSIICFILCNLTVKAKMLMFPVCFDEYRLDSSYSWTWDADIKQWKLMEKVIFALDANGNIISNMTIHWNGVSWENQIRYFFEYDAQNNLINYLWQQWDNNSWINLYRVTNSYDINNLIKNGTSEKWNGINWENSSKTDYVYENNQYLKSWVTSSWSNGSWLFISRQLNSFDSNYNVTNSVNQHWDSVWKNVDKFQFTYNANHDIMTELFQRWVNEDWVDGDRYTWFWDYNRRPILIQRERNNGGEWVYDVRDIYTYNLPNKQSHIHQWFTNDQWINYNQGLYEYNPNHDLISEVFQDWEEDQWINEDSTHIYYSSSTALRELTSEFSGLTIYPNPATTTINLNLETIANDDRPVLEIYSSTGLKMTGSVSWSQQNKTIDVSQFLPGSYSVLIHTRKGVMVRSFVKL